MKEEKQLLVDHLTDQFKGQPFIIVTDYEGLDVPGFAALRGKLKEAGAECHVFKNSLVKRAAEAAEVPEELAELLTGQTAIVSGGEDISAAAKAIVDTEKDIGKPAVKAAFVDGKVVDESGIRSLASLPPLPVLQAKLLGLFQAPAGKLVRTINEPGASLARLLAAKAKADS